MGDVGTGFQFQDQSLDVIASIESRTMTYMDYLRDKGTAEVIRLPVKADRPHIVEIEGIVFALGINIDGPYIERRSARTRGNYQGFVNLGVSSIFHVEDSWWHICKYDEQQPRVSINDLSTAGRYALAYEFGIPIMPALQENGEPSDPYPDSGHRIFYLSPAFHSLAQWAKKHPRKAKQSGDKSPYLAGWDQMANRDLM